MPPPEPSHHSPGGSRRVTIKDIAAAVGVSHTTVSLALHNSSKITEARRKEIQAMAKQMGYQLNPMGAGLAQYRSFSGKAPVKATLGWLNYWAPPEALCAHQEFDLYWRGAQDAAQRLGYRIESFENDPAISPERLTQILVTRNVQGLLLPPHGGIHREAFKRILTLDWSRFAVVRFGYTLPEINVSVVTSDHLKNMRLVLQNLRALGYTRIGYATEELQVSSALDAYMADSIKTPAQRHAAPCRVPTAADAHRASLFMAWYRKEKPDAIVSDLSEVSRWLAEAGIQVPDEVGLAAMSVLDGTVDTGIDQYSYDIGKAAVEVLVSRINNGDRGEQAIPREVLIPGKWVSGSMA